MHPKIAWPGELATIVEDLSRPLHSECRRDPARSAHTKSEVSLANGYELEDRAFHNQPHIDVVLADWREFMGQVMSVQERTGSYRVRLLREQPVGIPRDATEGYALAIRPDGCEVTAADVAGLRRAFFRLEDEMKMRRAPVLPRADETRWAGIKTRITRSPIAPYRWLSGWELEDENDYYPEAYLNRLAHDGINALWVPGLFRNLVASRVFPELGPPAHRLDKLRGLVEKTARYGIKVFFFCIEPRALPVNHPAGGVHPDLVGARTDIYEAICPSSPRVLEYLREVTSALFREAPGLGGLINIFCGERPTTCAWDEEIMSTCPRCRDRSRTEVLAEVLNAMTDGMHVENPSAELLAWTYIISRDRTTSPMEPMLEVMQKSRPITSWLANFEHGGIKEICGKSHTIHEYALSYPGPSEPFVKLAEAGRHAGRHVYAKLQVGTSCEMASVPYVPVPGLVWEKMAAMHRLGITGSLLTWTFGSGGYPGPMLKMAGEAAFMPEVGREELLRRLAGIAWGEAKADRVASAWEHFARAWEGYPFDLGVLYFGPVTRAPAYHLHLERENRTTRLYNFGLERNRDVQPWTDEVARWTGDLTANEIIASFRQIASRWETGLNLLEQAVIGESLDIQRQVAVAAAVRLQCLSTANVYEFYVLRDRLREAREDDRVALVTRLREVAEDEVTLSGEMIRCLEIEPTLGYFIELYAKVYSIPLIEEKTRQVCDTISTLRRWESNKVDMAVLDRTVEEAEKLRPDRWGD